MPVYLNAVIQGQIGLDEGSSCQPPVSNGVDCNSSRSSNCVDATKKGASNLGSRAFITACCSKR